MKSIYKFILKYCYFFLGFIIVFHSYVITQLIFFPFPEFFLLPYLTNAGLIPYKEIIDQHSPGLFFLPLNAGVLGLSNVFIARAWLIIITALTNLLIFFIVKSISKNAVIALLASLFFFFWHPFWGGWVLWIDSFIGLILLPAFYLSYLILESKNHNRNRLILLLGFVFGAGIILKQITLPIAACTPLLIYFFVKEKKIFLYFLAGFLPLPLVTAVYLFNRGALTDFIYWGGIFNATVYPAMSRKAPEYPGLIHMVISYSPILFFPLIKNRKIMLLLCLFIFWSLIAVVDRFDSSHFQPSLPFLAIGTALLIYQYFQVKRFLAYILVYLLISTFFIYKDYKKHISDEVIIYDGQMISVAEKVKTYTEPGEEIFIYGVNPLLYYLSETMPAGRYFVFQLPWYITALDGQSVRVLENTKPEIVIQDKGFNVDGEMITEFAPKLNKYIDENYVVFDKIRDTEFLKRKD